MGARPEHINIGDRVEVYGEYDEDNADWGPSVQLCLSSDYYITPVFAHIEVTQATQDETNSVPLIANKPTFARAYVACGADCTPQLNITGTLRAYDSADNPLNPPSISSNNSINTVQHDRWQELRDDLKKTLNFTLPPEWLTGTIKLEAVVSETVVSQVTVTFEPAKSLTILYVPIRYNDEEPEALGVEYGFRLAEKVYPTAEINYEPLSGFTWKKCLNKETCNNSKWQVHKKKLIKKLTNKYRFYRFFSLLKGKPIPDYIFGWLPKDAYENNGTSDPRYLGGDNKAAFGSVNSHYERIFAHEIGHLLGRRYTNTLANLLEDKYCRQNSGLKPQDYEGTQAQWEANVDPLSDWDFDDSKIQNYGCI